MNEFMRRNCRRLAPCCLAVGIAAVAGCVGIPADLGRSDVDALARERGLPVPDRESSRSAAERIRQLTKERLTTDDAVRIALINSPVLMAEYARLGFAAADVYEGGRIRNPVLFWSRLDSTETGAGDQVTLGLVTSLTDLITLPARKRLSSAAFAAVKQSIGSVVANVAADTEQAYYLYVGAQQVAELRTQVAKAADLSAALAQRYHDAGNISARELALERAAASEARIDKLEAEARAVVARAELARVLGLSSGDHWQVPARLNVPLVQEDELPSLLALARDSRLDLAAARANVELLADTRDVTDWSRWIQDFDVGYEREDEPDGSRIEGPLAEWKIPIIGTNLDALLRSDAELGIAIAELQRIVIDVDNGVRFAHADVQNARARIREYSDGLIPQRIESVARAQEEVNFMLIGIFELIATKQLEYDAYQGYLEAVRDYWLARTELGRAVGSSLPSSRQMGEESLDVEDFVRPQPRDADHSSHDSMQPGRSTDEDIPMDHSRHGNDGERNHEQGQAEAVEKPNATEKRHDHGGDLQ